jgi:hypothetical protein
MSTWDAVIREWVARDLARDARLSLGSIVLTADMAERVWVWGSYRKLHESNWHLGFGFYMGWNRPTLAAEAGRYKGDNFGIGRHFHCQILAAPCSADNVATWVAMLAPRGLLWDHRKRCRRLFAPRTPWTSLCNKRRPYCLCNAQVVLLIYSAF